MTKYKPEYRCPECDGEGKHECESCRSDVVCDVCRGSGLNAAGGLDRARRVGCCALPKRRHAGDCGLCAEANHGEKP